MAVKKGTVPFNGTKEQEEALKKSIAELKSEKGALMPILQKAQDIYGYLPMEVQKMISDETGIPLEKIYGVCTPDGKFSLDACRCVGACGLAPVMMINDEVYGRLTVDDLDGILAKYE